MRAARVASRCVGALDGLMSVSRHIEARFLSWCAAHDLDRHLLPNCVDRARPAPRPCAGEAMQQIFTLTDIAGIPHASPPRS